MPPSIVLANDGSDTVNAEQQSTALRSFNTR